MMWVLLTYFYSLLIFSFVCDFAQRHHKDPHWVALFSATLGLSLLTTAATRWLIGWQ